LTPVSIKATVTPLPVEYCHALVILSMAKPAVGRPTSGLATVIAWAQTLLCRMGWSGPGGPSDGTNDGSMIGGAIAIAPGAWVFAPVNSTAMAMAVIRNLRAVLIASEPR